MLLFFFCNQEENDGRYFHVYCQYRLADRAVSNTDRCLRKVATKEGTKIVVEGKQADRQSNLDILF